MIKKLSVREAIDVQHRVSSAMDLVYTMHLNSTYMWLSGSDLLSLEDAINQAARCNKLLPGYVRANWFKLVGDFQRNDLAYSQAKQIIDLLEKEGLRYISAYVYVIGLGPAKAFLNEVEDIVVAYFSNAPWKPSDFIPNISGTII